MTDATFSVSANGAAVINYAPGANYWAVISSILLGFEALQLHVQFFGIYALSQIPNLQFASALINAPPTATGANSFSANFVAGAYHLNGSSAALSALFVANTDGSVIPPAFTIDGEGALVIAGIPTNPIADGSSGMGTSALVSTVNTLSQNGGFTVIIKYTIDAPSDNYGGNPIGILGSECNTPGSTLAMTVEDFGFTSGNVAECAYAGVGGTSVVSNASGSPTQIALQYTSPDSPCGFTPLTRRPTRVSMCF